MKVKVVTHEGDTFIIDVEDDFSISNLIKEVNNSENRVVQVGECHAFSGIDFKRILPYEEEAEEEVEDENIPLIPLEPSVPNEEDKEDEDSIPMTPLEPSAPVDDPTNIPEDSPTNIPE